jgi:hypothetical protein
MGTTSPTMTPTPTGAVRALAAQRLAVLIEQRAAQAGRFFAKGSADVDQRPPSFMELLRRVKGKHFAPQASDTVASVPSG